MIDLDVLKATKKLIKYTLLQGPKSIADLSNFAEKLHVDDFKITRREDYYLEFDDDECPDPKKLTEDSTEQTDEGKSDISSLKYQIRK